MTRTDVVPAPPTRAAGAPPALRVAGLAVELGGVPVLRGVDASVPAGRVTALVGPNGSGKSTLLRVLVGAVRPAAGSAHLEGRDLLAIPRRERARELALVEQDAPADVALSVADVVLLGRTPHRPRWGADSVGDLTVAHRALERVGAAGLTDRAFATLSGGERQRVHLARALAQDPHLLLLDEPTNHLDVAAQLRLLALVHELADVTVVMALHDLNHALRWCDHVVLLDAGRVAAEGPPSDVLTPAVVDAVYGVRSRRVPAGDREVLLLDPA